MAIVSPTIGCSSANLTTIDPRLFDLMKIDVFIRFWKGMLKHFITWLLVPSTLCSMAHLPHLLWHIPERAPGKKMLRPWQISDFWLCNVLPEKPHSPKTAILKEEQEIGVQVGYWEGSRGNQMAVNWVSINLGNGIHIYLTSFRGLEKLSKGLLEKRKGWNCCYFPKYYTSTLIILCPL